MGHGADGGTRAGTEKAATDGPVFHALAEEAAGLRNAEFPPHGPLGAAFPAGGDFVGARGEVGGFHHSGEEGGGSEAGVWRVSQSRAGDLTEATELGATV